VQKLPELKNTFSVPDVMKPVFIVGGDETETAGKPAVQKDNARSAGMCL